MEQFFTVCHPCGQHGVWSMVLVLLCLGVGLYLLADALSADPPAPGDGAPADRPGEVQERRHHPFPVFCHYGGRPVGMGNIAGVASAIFYGGPGSVFWMWIIALISAVSAYAESALAQAYKVRNADGTYQGGPAYYIEKGLKCKPLCEPSSPLWRFSARAC